MMATASDTRRRCRGTTTSTMIVKRRTFCSSTALVALASLTTQASRGFKLKGSKSPRIRRSHMTNLGAITSPTGDPSMSTTLSASSLPLLSDRCLDTFDPCVVLMKNMISEYQHLWQGDEIYSLAQGVVWWEPPDTVYRRIEAALKDTSSVYQLHMYCEDEGLLELRAALQHKLAAQNFLTNQNVVVTAGANQAFVNCAMAFLSKDSKCVVFRPYYFNHVMAIQLLQGNEGVVVGDCDQHGIPDTGWLEERLEQDASIRMVTLVNPGNPTGVSLKREKIQEIVDLCAKHNVWLVLDCTYEHFDHTSTDPSSFAGFEHDHVVHIFSFSKGHAMAGFRCGYIALSNSTEHGLNAYQQILKVQDTIPICPSRISQIAALGALEAGRSWVVDKVATLNPGRAAILKAMEPLNTIMGGTGAMYVMGKLPDGMDNDQDVARILVRDFGVGVIPGSFCGFPGWIRVCYSNLPIEKCEIAASRLEEGLKTICTEAAL